MIDSKKRKYPPGARFIKADKNDQGPLKTKPLTEGS